MAKKVKLSWDNLADKLSHQDSASVKTPRPVDERFYQLKFNEDGTAGAIIRFLPGPNDSLPVVKWFRHRFQGRGFFWANCPTSIGKQCPVCTANRELWSSDPETCKQRARQACYVANIVVVKDPAVPANEGKVFLYRFGKQIYTKIMDKIKPPKGALEDGTPVIVFDYYEGANFKLVAKMVNKRPNFNDASFTGQSKLGTDEDIARIHGSLYDLSEFIKEDQFKSYEELEERFNKVTGTVVSSPASAPAAAVRAAVKPSAAKVEDLEPAQNDEDFLSQLRADA